MSNPTQRCSGPAVSALGWTGDGPMPPARFRSVWQGTIGRLRQWLAEQRQRRRSINRLQQLNEWLLRDIGIDREDIGGEVDRLLSEQRFGMVGPAWNRCAGLEEDGRTR
jgi:uncharacterized protein YjiS (DUF1127 family)